MIPNLKRSSLLMAISGLVILELLLVGRWYFRETHLPEADDSMSLVRVDVEKVSRVPVRHEISDRKKDDYHDADYMRQFHTFGRYQNGLFAASYGPDYLQPPEEKGLRRFQLHLSQSQDVQAGSVPTYDRVFLQIDWKELYPGDVIPFVNGHYRVGKTEGQHGPQQKPALWLERHTPSNGKLAVVTPGTFAIPERASYIRLTQADNDYESGSVSIRELCDPDSARPWAEMTVSVAGPLKGISQQHKIVVYEGDVARFPSGWHRVVRVVPTSVAERTPGWVELEPRIFAPRIFTVFISPNPPLQNRLHSVGGHQLHFEIENDPVDGRPKLKDWSLRLPPNSLGRVPAVVNVPSLEIGAIVPLFNFPYRLDRVQDAHATGPDVGKETMYRFVCDADLVVHPDRAVPHLSAVVVPESDGERGWLGIGDPEPDAGVAGSTKVEIMPAPLPELPFRLTVQKAVDRDRAIVKLRSRAPSRNTS